MAVRITSGESITSAATDSVSSKLDVRQSPLVLTKFESKVGPQKSIVEREVVQLNTSGPQEKIPSVAREELKSMCSEVGHKNSITRDLTIGEKTYSVTATRANDRVEFRYPYLTPAGQVRTAHLYTSDNGETITEAGKGAKGDLFVRDGVIPVDYDGLEPVSLSEAKRAAEFKPGKIHKTSVEASTSYKEDLADLVAQSMSSHGQKKTYPVKQMKIGDRQYTFTANCPKNEDGYGKESYVVVTIPAKKDRKIVTGVYYLKPQAANAQHGDEKTQNVEFYSDPQFQKVVSLTTLLKEIIPNPTKKESNAFDMLVSHKETHKETVPEEIKEEIEEKEIE